MSRKAVATTFIAYLVVAVAFGVGIAITRSSTFDVTTAATAGDIASTAFGAYVASGALPLIYWAFRRFRSQQAAAPLFVWGILGLAYMGLVATGNLSDWNDGISGQVAKIATLSGKDYEDYLQSVKTSCVENQQGSQINQQGGATASQIATYCHCFAEAIAKQATADELEYAARNGKPSASLQEKANKIMPSCSRLALGR
jgi:uncharacterized protein YdbL (DUF1318 family)